MYSIKMETVLRKIGLDNAIEAFRSENITPDIVCKMPLYDMRCVGINDKTEIMKLRTACIPYGSITPNFQTNSSGGAPSYQISKECMETRLSVGYKISEIAQLLSVSESTVYRRMRVFGLAKLQFTDICDEELTVILKGTIMEFPKCGERMLIEILRQKNIIIPRCRLRDILHLHDEDGLKERRIGRLHRRIYHVQGPNAIWHVDTNHKLIRWGFVISGAIDGFSRLVTVLHCLDNNRADSLLELFKRGTESFGTPRRVRTDMGMENIRIAEFMFNKRGSNGYISGKSTHNQRIERLWRDVFDGALVHYYQLFTFMEDESILDILNPLHIFALHYVFKHKINEKLDIWREAWASHRLRTVGSSPLRLWTSGVLNGELDTVYSAIYDSRSDLPTNERPVFQPDLPDISADCLRTLSRSCPKDWVCSNYGINVYQTALRIVTE